MSTLTWITEKELERVIKNKGSNYDGRKHGNFIAADEKMRNSSVHQGENER